MLVTEAALLGGHIRACWSPDLASQGPSLSRLPCGVRTPRSGPLASQHRSWASTSKWGHLVGGGCPFLAQALGRTKAVKASHNTLEKPERIRLLAGPRRCQGEERAFGRWGGRISAFNGSAWHHWAQHFLGQMLPSVVGHWRSSWLRKPQGSPTEPLSPELLSPGLLSMRPDFLEGVGEKPQIGVNVRKHFEKGGGYVSKKKDPVKGHMGNPLFFTKSTKPLVWLRRHSLPDPRQSSSGTTSLVPSWHPEEGGCRGGYRKGKKV